MFFKRHKTLAVLGVVIIFLLIFTLYFQQKKLEELQTELSKVELQDVRIGAGTSKGKLGTAIFGVIINKGEQTIKIATMSVEFFDEAGELSTVHKFFPVNNYSFSDSSALEPAQSKEFGFPIDEIVPENWGGTITSKLIDLKFK
jgi:hypothetical protein